MANYTLSAWRASWCCHCLQPVLTLLLVVLGHLVAVRWNQHHIEISILASHHGCMTHTYRIQLLHTPSKTSALCPAGLINTCWAHPPALDSAAAWQSFNVFQWAVASDFHHLKPVIFAGPWLGYDKVYKVDDGYDKEKMPLLLAFLSPSLGELHLIS